MSEAKPAGACQLERVVGRPLASRDKMLPRATAAGRAQTLSEPSYNTSIFVRSRTGAQAQHAGAFTRPQNDCTGREWT